jgi:hypothetical protein
MIDTKEFDRIVIASFQPDKEGAAKQLASALVNALGKMTLREGFVVIQIDELLRGADTLFAEVPFLPSEPVAVCLTGTPRVVATISGAMSSASKARFAKTRAPMALGSLRIGAFVRDGKLILDINREFAGRAAQALAKANWDVMSVGEEEHFELFQAQRVLDALASRPPSPFVPPAMAKLKKEPSPSASASGQEVRGKGRAMAKEKPSCPRCGSKKVLRIMYGYPSPEAERDAMAGKFILGGCCVEPGQPDWYCKECDHSWPNEQPRVRTVDEAPRPAIRKASSPASRSSVMGRFLAKRAEKAAKGAPVTIRAVGVFPPEDRKRIPLDEDWLKKVHAKRVAGKTKRPRRKRPERS